MKTARTGLRQFVAIAGLTALEIARQPICLILATTCVMLMILASVQAYQFGEEGKFVRDTALAIHFFFGLLVAAYAACTALSREFRNGTASAVLCKPVGRGLFFLSKYAGVAAAIILFSVCATGATLLCEEAAPRLYKVDRLTVGLMAAAVVISYAAAGLVNYFWKRPFPSTAFSILLFLLVLVLVAAALRQEPPQLQPDENGHTSLVERSIQWRLVPASALVTLALLVLAAIALALATRLDTVPVVLLSCGVLLLGLMSDYLFGRSSSAAAVAAHRLVPNWQYFWLADALTGGGRISWRYVGGAALYALLYASAMLGAGALLFRHKET